MKRFTISMEKLRKQNDANTIPKPIRSMKTMRRRIAIAEHPALSADSRAETEG